MQHPIEVSVLMITYNHQKFIIQAIESVLMQETNFKYELVIGDDLSTDETGKICKEYQTQYPSLIRVLDYTKNVGVTTNFINVYNACGGKYIAILEGDDYWIDSKKLQKQFDYLNNNIECNLVYTQSKDFHSYNNTFTLNTETEPQKLNFVYLLHRGWFIRTATTMFRKNIDLNNWKDVRYSLDYLIHLLCALKGSVDKINDITTIYRRHENGISNVSTEAMLKRMAWFNDLLVKLNNFSNFIYDKNIRQEIKNNSADIFIVALQKFKFKYFIYIINSNILKVCKTAVKKVITKIGLTKA
jgi:glycosyltransferase involved in cell wall biosynthesis